MKERSHEISEFYKGFDNQMRLAGVEPVHPLDVIIESIQGDMSPNVPVTLSEKAAQRRELNRRRVAQERRKTYGQLGVGPNEGHRGSGASIVSLPK